jgi:hypothetical protein
VEKSEEMTRRCMSAVELCYDDDNDDAIEFDVGKSVHTVQINQTTRCKSFTNLLLEVYVWLNTFRASPRPSSGAYNCTRSLLF